MPRLSDSDRTMNETNTNPKSRPGLTKSGSVLIGAIDAAAVAALVAMMIHVLANVAARRVMGETVPLTFELTQFYYLPILALLGFVAAQHRGENITSDVFYSLFSRGEKRAITAATSIIGAVIAFGLAYYTLERAEYAVGVRLEYGVTSLQVWPVLYLVPACFAVMGALVLVQGASEWRLSAPAAGRHGQLQPEPVSDQLHGEERL